MSTTKPTILLIPGSFSHPSIYTPTITSLRGAGYPSVALDLPSTQKRMPLPPANLSDDAKLIKRAAEQLLAQGKQVVVVAHSYGGAPMTQALAGMGEGVKRLVYVTAVAPRKGGSQVGSLGMAGVLVEEAVDGYMHIDPIDMAPAVCNDLPFDLAYENARNLQHHSAASFVEKITEAAYETIPASYILCEDDLVITPEQQRGFIEVIEEVSGNKVSVVSLKSGHCPNFSMPEKLAEVIIGEAERA